MNSASFDLSITVLDISCLTRLAPRIKLSCKSVNRQYAVISGPAVTQLKRKVFFDKKKTERQAKTSKKVKLHANKSVSSRQMTPKFGIHT